MSKNNTVQKKALKKRAAKQNYPIEVATKPDQTPMSDADFIASIAKFCAENAGESFKDTLIEMLESATEGRLSKKQYRMLDSAMNKYVCVRIPNPRVKLDVSPLEEFPFLGDF